MESRTRIATVTSNDLTNDVIKAISREFPQVVVWRNNRFIGKAIGKDGKERHVSAGVDGQGDISGIIGPAGLRLEIEIKVGRDRIRPTQIGFRAMIRRHGGVYIEARDVQGVLGELRVLTAGSRT